MTSVMRNAKRFFWCLMLMLLLNACGSQADAHAQAHVRYVDMLKVGLAIPICQRMHDAFENTNAFVSHSTSDTPTFNLSILAYGRYDIEIQQPLTIVRTAGTVPSVMANGQLDFYIHEIVSYDFTTRGISYGDQWQLTPAEVSILLKNQMDFRKIGIIFDVSHPVAGVEQYFRQEPPP